MSWRIEDGIVTRVVLVILGMIGICAPLRAQTTAQSPQAEAAAADARESLRHQILSLVIARGMTVRELLERTGGEEEFTRKLNGAQQIGGTRWLDDQTAQVRLVIEGGAVGDFLNQVAAKNPEKVPAPIEDV